MGGGRAWRAGAGLGASGPKPEPDPEQGASEEGGTGNGAESARSVTDFAPSGRLIAERSEITAWEKTGRRGKLSGKAACIV